MNWLNANGVFGRDRGLEPGIWDFTQSAAPVLDPTMEFCARYYDPG